MKLIMTMFLIIAIASVFYSSHGAPIRVSEHKGGQTWERSTRPAVFDLNLYKNHELIRSCQGAELDIDGKHAWITAAECLDTEKYDHIEIQFYLRGTVNREKIKLGGKYFHVHPQYVRGKSDYNIGLIFPFINYVESEPSIRRLQLPSGNDYFAHKEAKVFWHDETNHGESYKILSADAKIYPSEEDLFTAIAVDPRVYAGGLAGKGINRNDIGMPLVVNENEDTFKIAGIVAEMRTWAKPDAPLLTEFLSIEPYVQWIRSF